MSGTLKLMLDNGAVFGRKISSQDLIDMVKEEYGIDLDKEVRKE